MTTTQAPSVVISKFLSRHEVANGTNAFRFAKPPNWTFQAGQYLDITLLNPSETDAEGNTRSFSIASSPQEDFLMVATRMRSTAFKRELDRLPSGAEVRIEGPSGDLTLSDDSLRTAVLLAGGIGITPFRSIACNASQTKCRRRIILFYSNRRPEDAPFLDELKALEKENPNYKIVATMTDMVQSRRSWSGETGIIDREMLARYLTKNAASPIYYVAGPPEMVKGLRKMIQEAGVGDEDICAEEFAGY
jgi:ferredoxin-NADP reductase